MNDRTGRPRLDRITTGGGDDGSTGIADGSRLPKTDPRIEALGDVDELNSLIGALRAALDTGDVLDAALREIQNRLFDLGAALSMPATDYLDEAAIGELESRIAEHNAGLPPLANFVIPAGSEATTRAHVARSACRRAERRVLALLETSGDQTVRTPLVYLNRLSDLLFILARTLARRDGPDAEQLWQPRG